MDKLAIYLVLAIAIFHLGATLKCHQCNSYEHAKCSDPFVYEPDREGEKPKVKTTEFLKECPKDRNYTLCRKIYQNVRGDERIIRSCGYETDGRDCYKTVLEEYNTYVCQCSEDGCNSAINWAGSLAITVLAISAIVAVFVR